MGREYIAECRQCHHRFTVKEGGGRDFYLLHCDICGKEKIIRRNELLEHDIAKEPGLTLNEKVEKIAGSCEKGQFTLQAKARCPKCNSDDYQIAVDADGQATMAFYD